MPEDQCNPGHAANLVSAYIGCVRLAEPFYTQEATRAHGTRSTKRKRDSRCSVGSSASSASTASSTTGMTTAGKSVVAGGARGGSVAGMSATPALGSGTVPRKRYSFHPPTEVRPSTFGPLAREVSTPPCTGARACVCMRVCVGPCACARCGGPTHIRARVQVRCACKARSVRAWVGAVRAVARVGERAGRRALTLRGSGRVMSS